MRLNIKLSDRVVLYDTAAAQFFGHRTAWMLKAMGHQNVHVLDGGLSKWIAEGGEVESTDAHAKKEDFSY